MKTITLALLLLLVPFAFADDGPRPQIEQCYSCNTHCTSHAPYYGGASPSLSGSTGCITHYGGCAGGCVWCEYNGWPCRYCESIYNCNEPSKPVEPSSDDEAEARRREFVATVKIAAFLSDSPFMTAEEFADFAAEVEARIGSESDDAFAGALRLAAYRAKYTEMTGRTLSTWTAFPVWPRDRDGANKRQPGVIGK